MTSTSYLILPFFQQLLNNVQMPLEQRQKEMYLNLKLWQKLACLPAVLFPSQPIRVGADKLL